MDESADHLASGSLAEQPLKKRAPVDERELNGSPELKVASEDAAAQVIALSNEKQTDASIRDLTRAMPSARSGSKGDEVFEPLAMLPKAFVGLFFALTVAVCVMMFAFFVPSGLPRFLWFALPLQVYLAYCMMRLSDVIGMKHGTPPPLSPLVVSLISVVSLVCVPLFGDGNINTDYHYPYRWLDPFWILWSLAQCVWPLVLSFSIEKGLKLRTLIATTIGALPVLGMTALPILFNSVVFFMPLWVVSQFSCVMYLSLCLRQVFSDDLKIMSAKLSAIKAKVSGVQKDDIVVRYRPYAAIERWLRQRITGGDLIKGTQLLLLWISVPVIAIGLYVAMWAFDNLLNTSTVFNNPHMPKAAAQAMANNTGLFLRSFLLFVSVMVGVPLFAYFKAPTHLLFNRHGMKLLWRHGKYARDGVEIDWKNLDSIDLERRLGSTQALDQFLCFRSNSGQVNKLKLSAFDTVEDREKILAMIRNWAPNVPRAAEVDQCLEPPANHSYTEMWLQALAAPPKRERLKPLLEGASLQTGKYRILHSLGVGGQGSAYLANDNIDDDVVVLKEFILPVHVDVNVRKSALESFENEARILKQIDSTGVVKLIDFFVEDHRAYLVLEHIDGMSLRELVEKNGAMKESQVKELAVQMCGILSYLHSLSPPVVHRDFTPDNLILQRDGTLKLIDFNVAQQVEATVTGTVVGKHAYLPPEQFRGMPASQSDIYACGATLHFLLTGSDPEPISVSHPAKQVANLSNGIDHIVARATQLDCDQRYDTVELMAKDLEDLT
jgi:predicted Ser/Thr protein kinase